MALRDVTREGVLQAVAEFDRLKRDAFLERYGFGPSRRYFLAHAGTLYDSKAIVGVAHGYSFDGAKPLRSEEFSGGEQTVKTMLEALGFEVVVDGEHHRRTRWWDKLQISALYTRDQIAEIIGYPEEKRGGGDFDTGYTKHDDAFIIFANVGNAGRTGHNYANRWDGRNLIWFGKSSTRIDQPRIQEMISGEFDVYVFWRGQDRSPFTFAGVGNAVEVEDTTPVRVTWSFDAAGNGAKGDERKQKFRRGPRPTDGRREFVVSDGPCSVYLMVLSGLSDGVLVKWGSKAVAIKVGLSNDLERRRAELNFGFPPVIGIEWQIVAAREYGSFGEAFEAETRLLEYVRLNELGVGGEFAVVEPNQFDAVVRTLREGGNE